jgi:hypothetical protein
MKDKKIQEAEEQLKRVLLMMKYDSSKTLSENKNIVYEQNNQCANTIDSETIKTKAKRIGDLVNYMNTAFIRMGYVDERCKEIYDVINESSKKNFYDEPLSICQNSLKRLKDEFESYYSDYFSGGDTLEEEIQDLIDGDMVKKSPTAKSYLQSSLKILNENINKVSQKELVNKCPEGQIINPKTNKCEPLKKGGTGTSKYKVCNNFPYGLYCKSEVIRKVQQCLGTKDDSLLGPATENALKANGYSLPLTKEMYDKIIAKCSGTQTSTQQTEVNPYDNWEPNEPETGDASINKQETDTTEG